MNFFGRLIHQHVHPIYTIDDLTTTISDHKEHKEEEFLWLLNATEINIRGLNQYGKTPLYYAVSEKLPTYIFHLLEHGADPNDASLGGNKLLELAFRQGELATASLLMLYGATLDNVNLKENEKDIKIKKYLEQKRDFYATRIKPYLTQKTPEALRQLGAAWLEIYDEKVDGEMAKNKNYELIKKCCLDKANGYFAKAKALEALPKESDTKIKEVKGGIKPKLAYAGASIAGLRHRAEGYKRLDEKPSEPSESAPLINKPF